MKTPNGSLDFIPERWPIRHIFRLFARSCIRDSMEDQSGVIKCQEELKRAIGHLEIMCNILSPVKYSLANFEQKLTAYANGQETFETPLKWAVSVMSTFLRRIDGSDEIRQMIRNLDMTHVSTYKDFMELADKWTKASATSSPVCNCFSRR